MISQRIDISDVAEAVNDPGVDYVLAGWFGGAGAQEDMAGLTARFFDAAGTVLGSNTVGNVSAADRLGVTGLLERTTNGVLPASARYGEFSLTNLASSGPNDASADNLSFVLTPTTPILITACGRVTNGWQVEFTTRASRLYVLERSQNLKAWTQVTPPTPGSGQKTVLVDTNAPAGQAFYRVSCRQP